MQRWWWKIRYAVRSVMIPIICLQFLRTLIFPNPFDVLILFLLFCAYVGFLFGWY